MEGKNGRVSGAVYAQGQNCLDLMTKAYQLFMLTNPLHADVFPSVRCGHFHASPTLPFCVAAAPARVRPSHLL